MKFSFVRVFYKKIVPRMALFNYENTCLFSSTKIYFYKTDVYLILATNIQKHCPNLDILKCVSLFNIKKCASLLNIKFSFISLIKRRSELSFQQISEDLLRS